jgi:hypothetical protein
MKPNFRLAVQMQQKDRTYEKKLIIGLHQKHPARD